MYCCIVCLLIILSQLFIASSWAAEPPLTTDTLPEITVIDSPEVTTAGKSVLDRETIAILPQGDGSITDLLKILPGIQFGETSNSSLTGGEILPAEISISGGRVYDNNFMIDGLGNNSLLDPLSSNPYSITAVPGHSQELFLDSSLLETVVVQRSNISARYDGFTGGVIDMETRNPAKEFGGQIGYRTTRSEWTSFHVEHEDREDFEYSETAENQPLFRKHHSNLILDIPINDKMGVLLAYSQEYVKIPLMLLGAEENQYRKAENLFVKYRFQPNDKTDFKLSVICAPEEEQYFIKNTRNSSFTVERGGLSINASLKRVFDFVKVETILGWSDSENSRRSPNGFFSWDKDVESTSWGEGYTKYSQEGGNGDIDSTQNTLSMSSHFDFNVFNLYGLQHAFSGGFSYERSEASYKRYADTVVSQWTVATTNFDCNGADLCIPDEQYARKRWIYPSEDVDAEITFSNVYLQDSVKLGNITFRPGLHVGYNDLMKNTDYAARSVVSYDVFADGSTVVSAGVNRYYGKTFLTSALDDKKQGHTLEKRTLPQDWEDPTTYLQRSRFSSLKTPLVDEWSVALEQDALGGHAIITYIDRNAKNELAKSKVVTDDEWLYVLNNNGERRHKELTSSWERRWQNHYLLVDMTWQDSKSSNEYYSDRLDPEDLDEQICYDEKIISILDLPRSDYNREWSANLVYSVKLYYGFSFTNITCYRSGYSAKEMTDRNGYELPDGTEIDVYSDVSYSSSTTFDWKLAWECPVTTTQTMTITADVTNVFNRKLYTGTENEYEMGRQLWVGMDYQF